MIRSVFYLDGACTSDLSLEQIARAVQELNGLLWVNLEQPTEEEYRLVLRDVFHFHPLAIEDCQNAGYQLAKVDDFGDYLFVIVHALRPNLRLEEFDALHEFGTLELDCFLGRNYVVTVHAAPKMRPIEVVRNRVEHDSHLLQRGADFLYHAILDELMDEYMPLIDVMGEVLDRVEDAALDRPEPATLERILALKHGILTLRRVITPQREVINRLSRGDSPLIAPQNRIYYRDIYDHLVRLYDLSDSLRDVVTGTLDIYLSVTSNRLNEVMKVLTIVSTIFMPLSFLAGVYGMNFRHFPELNWHYGYAIAWAVFITVASIQLWIFRRKGWL